MPPRSGKQSLVQCRERDRCMTVSPLAGMPAPKEMLVDLARLEHEYFEHRPDLDDPEQRVSFGTSGHRGSSLRGSLTEAHILAITQAICDFRRIEGARQPAEPCRRPTSGRADRTSRGDRCRHRERLRGSASFHRHHSVLLSHAIPFPHPGLPRANGSTPMRISRAFRYFRPALPQA